MDWNNCVGIASFGPMARVWCRLFKQSPEDFKTAESWDWDEPFAEFTLSLLRDYDDSWFDFRSDSRHLPNEESCDEVVK
jgi:hypothetical protein